MVLASDFSGKVKDSLRVQMVSLGSEQRCDLSDGVVITEVDFSSLLATESNDHYVVLIVVYAEHYCTVQI